MIKFIFSILLTGILLVCTRCGTTTTTYPPPNSVDKEDLLRHISILASDEFEGRMPFTAGDQKTIRYLENEFKNLGLKPGNGDSYFQEVPLVEITGSPDEQMIVGLGVETYQLKYKDEFMAFTTQMVDEVTVENSDLVFVGYGIVASEYDWNDFEGIDVKGKTIVVLVNDPGFSSADSAFFKGRTMTYYGRWTYKFEEAARQGAEAILIIHQTAPAAYPWAVVRNSNQGAMMNLESTDNNLLRSKIEGWITYDAGKKIFEAAGLDYQKTLRSAGARGFKPLELGQTMSLSLRNTIRRSKSNNVVALYEGTERADEFIIYTAHWDHLGIGPPDESGDSIYNGAMDNASGMGVLLEIADSFVNLPERPKRSVVFLAVTAEEQGLLGSAFYAKNPIYPINKTVANINMDSMKPFGKMRDLMIVGFGQSEMEDYAAVAAKEQGRYIFPNPHPERGTFFRSDHFNFAKVGVPALYAKGAHEHWEKGVEWVEEQENNYIRTRYHQPADQLDLDYWDLQGMLDDAVLLFNVGYQLSIEDTFPQWKEGSEFKSIREIPGS